MRKPHSLWFWTTSIFVLFVALGIVVVLIITVIQALGRKHSLDSEVNTNLSASQLVSQATQQQQNGDLAGAEASLKAALVKNSDPDYQTQLAVVEYGLKNYSEAITDYQALISANQEQAFAWNGIGNAYRDWAQADSANTSTDQTKALAAYDSAIAADSGYVAAYSNKALLLYNLGQKTQAQQVASDGYSKTHDTGLQDLVSRLTK